MKRSWAVAALALAAAALTVAPAAGQPAHPRHWLAAWTAMPQLTEPGNMPPAPFVRDGVSLPDTTLRQTIRLTAGGPRLRLRFSNAFGGAPLPITAVSVAAPLDGRAGVSAVRAGSVRAVTFHGRPGTVVPVGAQVVSDPVDFPVAARDILAVTTYLAQGQASAELTSHPGSRTTSWLAAGDHVTDTDLPAATPVDHWYLLSGAEVLSPQSAVAVVGDSLSDGRGSTTNGNDRWPDRLADRLGTVVLNQAAGGNRVLQDGLGPNVLARLDRDVLAQTGVSSAVVFEGVNDIGTAAATPEAQREVAGRLSDAYDQIVTRLHAHGIRVFGATITPFGGNTGYDDPGGLREATRQQVNAEIRTPGRFDGVLDFDRVARDPAAPARLLPAFDTGDHLHLNPAGYRALADSVPAGLFGG